MIFLWMFLSYSWIFENGAKVAKKYDIQKF